MSTSVLKALPGKLDIKRHSPSILYIYTKIDSYVILANLKSEKNCKLINRIPGWPLLISRLLGWALRTDVESLGKPPDSTSVLKALPGKLHIKRHSHSILYALGGQLFSSFSEVYCRIYGLKLIFMAMQVDPLET